MEIVDRRRRRSWRRLFFLRDCGRGCRAGWSVIATSEVDGAMRVGELDAQRVEALLHPLIEFSADKPLFNGTGFDARFDNDCRLTEAIEAKHVERLKDDRSK